jgi:hypothetical protein
MPDTDVLNALSKRVKQLEDLEEIRQLYIDYGRHLDAGDSDAYAALRSVHLLASPRVHVNGDTASGECVWAAVAPSEDGASKVLVGRHIDELVREDGHWRFAHRRGYIDVGSVGS